MENKSIFLKVFGDSPKIRVIDFFIENHMFDFPVTEIARESKVSYNSLKPFLKNWIDNGIIIKTRRIGKSDYYQFNLNNLFVQQIIKLDWNLIKGKEITI